MLRLRRTELRPSSLCTNPTLGDKRLDDVDFLQRRDDQQLQIELREQLQPILGRLIGAAPERLVDHHEAERARAHRAPFQAELIRQAGGQHGVGQLLLLAARFPAGIGIMLVLVSSSRQRSLAAKTNQLRTSVTLAVQRRSRSECSSRPRKRSMIRFTCRNLASEYCASSDPVSAPSVQARSSVWKSRMSASGSSALRD
jgi:hypothetical protein